MTLVEYILLSFSTLFVIVDPIASVPIFLGMTPYNTRQERIRMARLACLVAAGVLLTFSMAGSYIFKLLGIGMPAFQIAGSLVLLKVAWDMVQGKQTPVIRSPEEASLGQEKNDIAVTPLAIPMLSGPAAITTVIMLRDNADLWTKQIALYGVIVGVCLASFIILRLAADGAQRIGPIAMKIITRIMGLLLMAIGVEFIISALERLAVIPKQP